MTYKIYPRERAGWYCIIMDYDHRKAVQLSDTMDTTEGIAFDAYYNRRDMDAYVILVHITDEALLRESVAYQTDHLYTVCAGVLGENDIDELTINS